MTPNSLLSEDRRRRIAAFVVWGRPGQFLTKRQIERRVEKILERIANKSVKTICTTFSAMDSQNGNASKDL